LLELLPWTTGDMALLVALNSPEMTEHLAGPESAEQLDRRLQRYLADASSMYRVVFDGVAVGSVGFWEREWKGRDVYETGWAVLTAYQGRGIASRAVEQVISLARSARRFDEIHAFPAPGNAPSNAICRKLGFELLGEVQFEYPKGHWAPSNDWRLRLR
jgi:RimJ/RimL family protein N-acetyltransferase